MTLKQQWGILLLTGLSFSAYAGLVNLSRRVGTLRDGSVPETIGWYLLAFGAYIGAVFWVEKRGVSRQWLWTTAFSFRLLLLLTTPTLSDDVYRYLWDGYIANEGVSPYMFAIEAPDLDYLDIPIRTQANNTWMASPYMPVAQWLFQGLTAVFPLTPLIFQLTMIVFDLAAAYLLSQLLAHAHLPDRRLILYLWNPLVIIETAHSAHLDAFMLLLTLLSIFYTLHHSPFTIKSNLHSFTPPFFLALATLTKLLPALLFPILFWQWNWRQRISYGLFTILLLIPAGMRAGWGLTGDLDGIGLFGALRIYGRLWNFNSSIFHWLELFLQKQGAASSTDSAKVIVFLLLLGSLTAVWLHARNRKSHRAILRLAIVPTIAYVLLTPTMHPWYLLILLAFLPFLPPTPKESNHRWLIIAPWLTLSGTLIFSYLTYLDPLNFGELVWVHHLEWIPTLLLLGTAVVLNFPKKPTVKPVKFDTREQMF